MKTRAVILAGGEGSRLGILTAKRTKPAVPFGGKYRIIDFPLSNCANSGIYDVMLIAQYRPHSLIEHIGAGGPWDLNRDFTGGIRIYTPYTTRAKAGWFSGTADAIQQNFPFINHNKPDLILILSGDHIYEMDYEPFITFHLDHHSDLTMATIRVPLKDASRFGIVQVDERFQVTQFYEKPDKPSSDLVNMGVYVFNTQTLDKLLREDSKNTASSHDFGKDIIPQMIHEGYRVFAYPYTGYWIDVGTIESYWQAHMDLLKDPPSIQLNNRSWIIHTRTEERSPVFLDRNASITNSLICDGCTIADGAIIRNSILSPGVTVGRNSIIEDSIILTDSEIQESAGIFRTICDKQVQIGKGSQVGSTNSKEITCLGKHSRIAANIQIPAGSVFENDSMVDKSPLPSEKRSDWPKRGGKQ